MSAIFNPSRNAVVQAQRNRHGYVAHLLELPTANAKTFGYVVFCGEDKRFYECQHIETSTEDYYSWIAVTSGGQRTFFIPVERLTQDELKYPTVDPRTNCFDAVASALDELAIGLYRYNIGVEPLCYKPCADTTYVEGKKYYVWYDSYDRAEYVVTEDPVPVLEKAYYLKNGTGTYVTVIFTKEGSTFEAGKTYFESTRPLFIEDPNYPDPFVAETAIDHRVFVSNGTLFSALTLTHLVNKTNEIIDAINVTNTKLSKVQSVDDCTLFDLCKIINTVIDEVNPFSNAWNNLLNRVSVLEEDVKLGSSADYPVPLPVYISKNGVTYTFDIDTSTPGSITPVIQPVS